MADLLSTHAFGKKANLEAAKTAGKIDAYDVVFLGDTNEIGWISKDGETVISTVRTQKEITVNGATELGVADGGKIPAGKTLDEVVQMLVQKSVPAKYEAPTIQLANNGGQAAGDVEAGTSVSAKLQATFTKKDAGNLTKLAILLGTTEVGSGTGVTYAYTGDPVAIGDEVMNFKAQATYEAGQVKADNLGNESPDGKIEAGTIASDLYTIAGRRKAFYGAGTTAAPVITSELVRGLDGSQLNPQPKQEITVTVPKGSQYVLFALPSERTISQISYDDMGDRSMLTAFTKSTVKVADARGGANGLKDYNCYLYTMKVPSAVAMTFTFVIA